MIGIYKITNPKGKIYIGQSVNIEKRFKVYSNNHCKPQTKLYNSLLKYGFEKHIFEVIEECLIDLLNERERYWQDYYNCISHNGLNCKLTKTNSKTGYLSIETKLKISKSASLMSQETKNKIGNSNKGKKRTEKFKKAISLRMTGRKIEESHRNKTSQKMIGIKRSDEFKLKCSLLKKGKKTNNKNRAKIILDFNTGVYYNSLKEISEILNINRITLYDNIIGKRKINKYSQYKYV